MKTAERLVLKEASLSPCRFKMAALLTKKGTILSKATNSLNRHAEINAIYQYCRLTEQSIHGCQLYVARVSKTGKWGLAKPCPECATFLQGFGIKTVYYTTNKGWQEEQL